MTADQYLDRLAAWLDVFGDVDDGDVSESVVVHGTCMRLYARGAGPWLTGDPVADRRVTGPICAGCPVRLACLEWEMRSAGADTTGPWGLLGELDRRAFYDTWSTRRGQTTEQPAGLDPTELDPGLDPGMNPGEFGCGGGR